MQVVMLPLFAALLVIPVAAHPSERVIQISVDQTAVTAMTSGTSLSLEQAFLRAEQQNPDLRRALAQRAAVEGEAADARGLLRNNPELSLERTRRTVPQAGLTSDIQREWMVGIAQTVEIAGQQGYRRQAARQELDALDASIEEARLRLRGEVERRFVQVLSLQERAATEQSSLKTIEDTALAIKKRVTAGEDSRLDGNLAQVEAVRARNQIGSLQEQVIQARAELGTILQLPPGQLPEAIGLLDVPTPDYTLEKLLEQSANRPQLRVLDHREQAATHRLSLEHAARYPDVTMGISTAREGASDARERITRLTLSLPLPLFRNNASGIGRASTDLTQAQIERQSAIRDTGADINAMWQKLQSQIVRMNALRLSALPALEENQRLSLKSLQAGEIGLMQLLLVNRQVLDGRRDLIDAETELRMTRIALQQAAGWLDTGAPR